MRTICIYRIRNIINGKVYVGQTVDFDKRCKNHLWMLKYNKHYNKALQRDYNKIGIVAFRFEVIEEVSILSLNACEQHWVGQYETVGINIYNVVKTMGI